MVGRVQHNKGGQAIWGGGKMVKAPKAITNTVHSALDPYYRIVGRLVIAVACRAE
jgi:hypothetical protein